MFRRRGAHYLNLLTLVFALQAISAAGQSQPPRPQKPVVIFDVRHDVSPPLREMPSFSVPVQTPREFDQHEHHLPQSPIRSAPVQDTAVQKSAQPLVAATTGLSFEGIGQGFNGFNLTGAPPDTNGAVGATQFVQSVNTAFAVFSKSNGSLLLGAEDFRTLFSGFGGPCQNDGGSDPVVVYDKLANRWVLSILITTAGQHSECLAVSTSSDATGSYNRYEMPFGAVLNDFPKWGVWPDAYYMTGNEFDDTKGFIGRQSCAVNRNAAINGQPLQMVCIQFPVSIPGAALPSDMDGTTPPAAGTPNFIFALGGNGASLLMFKFHVDFTTTSNSTLTGPTTISVAAFNELCPGSDCVPQSGTTQLLSSIGDVPNFRVAYRNFGNHESIVLNHSVSTNNVAGVRWYEIRSPNATPTVFQQGTFAPDSNWRWMGSVATDKAGDIGVGYSESSSAIHPSIAVTGRTPSDPLGTLESENVVFSGGGSQTPSLDRWGDYSAITVDPVDDCTFWYTTEYIPVNGNFNWHTRIVNFKMANCGAAATGSGVQADLSGAFNINPGIVTDGTTFTGGLDGGGHSYSANLLGSSLALNGVLFKFGAPNTANAVTSTTVTLPAGKFTSLKMLATGVQGNQAGQVFTVHFSDGTTQSFTQSLSDWFTPQNFAGESTAATTAHRDNANGTTDNRTFLLYAYSFTLDGSKTVNSITLPNNRNVTVLAITLTQAVQVNLGGAFNREGVVTDGTTFTTGLDGGSAAYSANLLGSTVTFGGIPFNLGAANTSNDVSAAGQTISLPAGQFSSLKMLATGVQGSQASQNFVVHFSDGTSSTFTQSLSDWFTPQNFAGESTAVTMAYRDLASGGKDNRTFLLYGYSFALNNTKTVSSITLPNNSNVEVLALTLVP